MVDLSRLIYDGMPKIPILPNVHVQKFLSLEKAHPLNGWACDFDQPPFPAEWLIAA